jgi:ubiquinone/menaquinone biosynthesis C-methylase UbiE
MAQEQATYSHGHHKSVVQDHARRTAQDSAAFLLPHIKPGHTILDVGCGPGSITADLADLVPQGHITGGDAVQSVLDQASEYCSSRGVKNVTFQKIDANDLPFPDNSFDIVFCHQVLQHVKSPVAILKEMRRVAKPGGIVAAREADYKSFAWYPETPEIAQWADLYQKISKANGGEPNAGRFVHVWARQAGFSKEEIVPTFDIWRYSGQRVQQFAESWSGRILQPGFLQTAVREEYASEDDIQNISKGWKRWSTEEDAFFAIPHGEILCRKT